MRALLGKGERIINVAMKKEMLQKMNMHVLCVKAFDMEATATPLLRTRAIVFFWRAAPWEQPGVCCVEKDELL